MRRLLSMRRRNSLRGRCRCNSAAAGPCRQHIQALAQHDPRLLRIERLDAVGRQHPLGILWCAVQLTQQAQRHGAGQA